ncbi:hypothetical protein AOLI_G00312260 [Acnodon oligacanthus]
MECEGEVEVYFIQNWRRVLLDSWSESKASVVCRQLGCGSVFNISSSSTSSPEHRHMCVTGFNCSGSEAHLGNCSSAKAVNCSSRDQLSITCSEFKEFRLTEGCEGNLEVFYNGTWGNVCVNGMEEETVSLICQELNCGRSGSESWAKSRVESAPNWLDSLKCRSYDSTLWQCPSSPWRQNNCDKDNEVAGITCSVGQTVKGTNTLLQTLPAAVPSIYPLSLLVLGVVLFLALVLLVVLFYQNRVLRRGLSKRLENIVYEGLRRGLEGVYEGLSRGTERVYEEIYCRFSTARATQRGSLLSEEQHSGYEDVDEELLSGSILSEAQHSGYEDVDEELISGKKA